MIPKFYITQSSDSYNIFAFARSLMPLKTFVKYEDLFVYSHISDDFVTVEVDCDYRLTFFIENDANIDNSDMLREIMEF